MPASPMMNPCLMFDVAKRSAKSVGLSMVPRLRYKLGILSDENQDLGAAAQKPGSFLSGCLTLAERLGCGIFEAIVGGYEIEHRDGDP